MKVDTSQNLSEQSVEIPEEIVECNFPDGIVGFPNSKNYTIKNNPNLFPFLKLKSVDEPHVEFAIVDPWLLKPDYEIEISDSDLERIKTDDIDNIAIFSIVTLYPGKPEISINLMAPVIINIKEKIGVQAIFDDPNLPLRFYIQF